MSEPYSLINKNVKLCLEGGWTFEGVVEYISSEVIVLKELEGPLVIYKSKIVAALILPEINSEVVSDQKKTIEYQPINNIEPEYISFNHVHGFDSESLYGSVIPEDMLKKKASEPPVDFSIQMSSLQRIETELNNPNDSRKEVKNNRKKY